MRKDNRYCCHECKTRQDVRGYINRKVGGSPLIIPLCDFCAKDQGYIKDEKKESEMQTCEKEQSHPQTP